MRRILLIDNYDSFTYNLLDYISAIGFEVTVIRNDECNGNEGWFDLYELIVLSPGPRTPDEAGNLMKIIQEQYHRRPILGICLGHQALGCFFGANLIKAKRPMHGKTSAIHYLSHPIFNKLSNPFRAMRYHSLLLSDWPEDLLPLAFSDENELMCFTHKIRPIIGFQFHPESIMTPEGLNLLRNTLCYLLSAK